MNAFERTIVTRDARYAQVWADPVKTVAARYGVTGVTLAKVCKKSEVPTPDRSYWSQRAAGKSPVQPRLAPARPGMETEYEFPRSPSSAKVTVASLKAP